MTWLLHLDTATLLWINGFARHSHLFDHFIVVLLDQEVLQGGIFFAFLWWLWFRSPDESFDDRVGVIRIVIAIFVADLVARAMSRYLPFRLRPINDALLPFVPPYGEWPSALANWSSFPSDHAIIFYALATAIWARQRWIGALAFIWITAFCAFTRIYTGMHYPGDILVGAIVGMLVMRLFDACPVPQWLMRLIRRGLAWGTRHPGLFYAMAAVGSFEFMSMCDDVRVISRGVAAIISGFG